MRYEFIESHRDEFPVALMCRVLGIPRQSYYDWRNRPPSRRSQENARLLKAIKSTFERSRQTYGSPRIHHTLRANGWRVGRNRVARLMRKNGLRAVQKRRKPWTTDSNHDLKVDKNIVARKFEAQAPNRLWLADITYVDTAEGWLFLAAVLDIYSRKIVGWAMSSKIDRFLCIDALKMAILTRKPSPGLVHHSDQGSQYASEDYQEVLKDHQMNCSMSRRANCWDNAPMESF
ncbi:IS3 family transposase, partial [Lujinxingia vulgaris]